MREIFDTLRISWCLFTLKCFWCQNLPMFTQQVPKNSIIKSINTTSITKCYQQCWKEIDDCEAVGFEVFDLNNGRTSAKCHMLKSDKDETGEVILLEVFVSYCNIRENIHTFNNLLFKCTLLL